MAIRILFGDKAEDLTETFSRTCLPAPTVCTGQKLRGAIVISESGMQIPGFDAIQLVLKGTSFQNATERQRLTQQSRQCEDFHWADEWIRLGERKASQSSINPKENTRVLMIGQSWS